MSELMSGHSGQEEVNQYSKHRDFMQAEANKVKFAAEDAISERGETGKPSRNDYQESSDVLDVIMKTEYGPEANARLDKLIDISKKIGKENYDLIRLRFHQVIERMLLQTAQQIKDSLSKKTSRVVHIANVTSITDAALRKYDVQLREEKELSQSLEPVLPKLSLQEGIDLMNVYRDQFAAKLQIMKANSQHVIVGGDGSGIILTAEDLLNSIKT